jgi:hypothetical protein
MFNEPKRRINDDSLGSCMLACLSFSSVIVAMLVQTVATASAQVWSLDLGITASPQTMAQLVAGGSWITTITLVNTSDSMAAQVRLNFIGDDGRPLTVPLNFPQPSFSPAASGDLGITSPTSRPSFASTLDRTLTPHAVLVIKIAGPDNAPTLVGWTQLLTNGSVEGFAVLRQQMGSGGSEAVVPFQRSGGTLSFDNTTGSNNGIALANLAAHAINIAATVRDAETGGVFDLDTKTLSLPAMGHTAFTLAARFPVTANRRGTIEFKDIPAPGSLDTPNNVSVLGLHFSPQGGFSTIPLLAIRNTASYKPGADLIPIKSPGHPDNSVGFCTTQFANSQTIVFSVKNQGTAPAPDFTIEIRFSPHQIFSGKSIFLSGGGLLLPGETREFGPINFPFGAFEPDSTFTIIVNPVAGESNTSNNSASGTCIG